MVASMKTPLNERTLEGLLKAAGIPVLRVLPSSDLEDACIEISGLVHVTIPTFGGAPSVVRDCQDDSFLFYEETPTLEGLIAQIKVALSDADAQVLQRVADAEDASLAQGDPSPC